MALFIAQTDGTDNFEVGQVQVDLISVSKVDSGLGFDEVNLQIFEGVTTIPVFYAQNENGPTPDRLNALVNDVGFASPPNIVIFGVDSTFVLDDGTTTLPLQGNGVALPVGDSLNPFANHVAMFYDFTLCGGAGVFVDKEGGGTTQETTDVVLYHELSHCFHFVTNTVAVDGDGNPDFAQEEVNAEIDENDMRDVRSLPHRDVNSHNGGCGGGPPPDCCIIASLTTGSPFSTEVSRFRVFREQILRRSEVGDDFFRNFFYHYYGFSPEVCRLLGRQPSLSPLIKKRFVMPLMAGLELLIHYARHKGHGLVGLLREQAERDELAEIYDDEFLNELAVHLSIVNNYDQSEISTALLSKGGDFAGVKDLLRYVNEQVLQDEFISWSLMGVMEIWLSSASLLLTEKNDEEINARIYNLISKWISKLPITSIWKDFSRLETEIELTNLESFIFDLESKEIFAKRLIEKHPKYSTTIRRWAQN